MAQRPRVLLDVDGVLCDFLGPCLKIINRLMGTRRTLDEMKTWHIFDALEVPKDIEKQVWRAMKEPGWCKNLPVYPDAVAGVKMLQEIADVHVCTSPMDGPTWVSERDSWLQKHFGISKGTIHTEAKYTTAGDVLIDDKTETLVKWHEMFPDGMPIRWHQVTNKHVPYSGWTCNGWEVAIDCIKEHIPTIQEHRRWTHK